jgi:NAD(P)-dependent dehydrogenase (short-subunit alcohol dehydrogenase family)
MSSNKARARIVVVTGASRGAGNGIALALGATGSTVYLTGRTTQKETAPLPGTVYETAGEITRAGARSTFVARPADGKGRACAIRLSIWRRARRRARSGSPGLLHGAVAPGHSDLAATGRRLSC